MLKKMLLLGLVLAVVAAHPQGMHRVRRYYYNEDRDLQNNENSHRSNSGIKGRETSISTQRSNSYSSSIYPQENNREAYSKIYPQRNSGQGPYRGSYGQESNGRSSYPQVSDHSFDQGRSLYRQDQIFQRQKTHNGGYQEFGY